MKEALPNRASIRKKGWDYTAGLYFVTINTKGGQALFGTIVNGRMVLSDAGRVAEACWQEIPAHFPKAQIDEFVIMPDHMHGIVGFDGLDMSSPYKPAQFGKPIAGALGTVAGAYKAAVSRGIHRRGLACQARTAIWHRNYWDVIVRDEKALANIRNYIRYNPQNYDAVMNVGKPRFAGNRALMDMPMIGFLASRGKDVIPSRLVVKQGEAILSGFLSPMERLIFQDSLKNGTPLIWVKPWGVQEPTASVRCAIEEGRLLIVSPFDDKIEAPSARRAVWCNQYVLAHSNRLVIGHLNRGGMLDCILSEANPEMEIKYL